MFIDIYALKKSIIHETVIMADCKNCGHHSGQKVRLSVFGQVQASHMRVNSGDRPNILWASQVTASYVGCAQCQCYKQRSRVSFLKDASWPRHRAFLRLALLPKAYSEASPDGWCAVTIATWRQCATLTARAISNLYTLRTETQLCLLFISLLEFMQA